ncbi:MAG: TIGR01777 family oxidoreductase [Deltaproteobacteria bacterium]
MRVLVTGATGLIGQPLCRALALAGHELRAFARNLPLAKPQLPAATDLRRVPQSETEWVELVDGCDAIINLVGEGIVRGRWTQKRKEELRSSRIDTATRLVEACKTAPARPQVLVNASAIGFYGARGDEPLDETSPAGDDFLAHMCLDWEASAMAGEEAGMRVATLRIGVVLSLAGGGLARMLPPFRLGLGGPLGNGQQFFSWIHEDDVTGLLLHALANDGVRGPMNATAPEPLTSRAFARVLGSVLGRPAFLSPPDWFVRLAFGEVADAILLTGQKVMPAKARSTGYEFRYPTAALALRALLGQ